MFRITNSARIALHFPSDPQIILDCYQCLLIFAIGNSARMLPVPEIFSDSFQITPRFDTIPTNEDGILPVPKIFSDCADSIQMTPHFQTDPANFNEFSPVRLGYFNIANSARMSPHFPCSNIGSGQTSLSLVWKPPETNSISGRNQYHVYSCTGNVNIYIANFHKQKLAKC